MDTAEARIDAQENAATSIQASPVQSPRKPNWALLEEAVQMKTEGNAFYRNKNLRSAIRQYHGALLILRGLDSEMMSCVKGLGPMPQPLTPEQETLMRNTQVDVYNNLAACLLQKETVNYARVQEYSLRVLQWQPNNTKALYRAGVATLELGDAQTAKEYFTQAFKEQPHDASVKKYLQKAEEKLNKELQKEKAMYREMFSSSVKNCTRHGVHNQHESGD